VRYLDAASGRRLDRPPVWLMRQAGRYLPEYREVRSRIGFQDAILDPEVAAELTLQPIRRFPLDAAILFADIMTPLEAMGVELTFEPGPKLAAPVTDASVLKPLDPPSDVGHVLEAVRIVRRELPPEVALIGFSGAPFTLAAYLAEGGGSRDFLAVRGLAAGDPEAFEALLDALGTAMAAYLRAQREAGADAVQLFDTWAGLLSRATFRRHVLPVLQRLVAAVGPGPVTYFAPGAGHLLDLIGELDVDVLGVDWRTPIDEIALSLPGRNLQGNVDPAVLLAGPVATATATADVLRRAESIDAGHILNLGHGITPGTPVESVEALVQTVVNWPGRIPPLRDEANT